MGAMALKEKLKNTNNKMLTKYIAIAVFIVVAIYCSVVLVDNYTDIARLKSLSAKANVEYNQQIEENEKIKAVLDSKNKDDYIEQKAREKGYAKDGETVYYDISSSK